MSGAQSVSTERLSSLLGHVTHKGYDDLVDPKNQGIAYPTGNPDLLITGDPLFYTNLLATSGTGSRQAHGRPTAQEP